MRALFALVLLPAWRLAADLVAALGGYGDARVCIRIEVHAVAADLGTFYRGLPGETEVTRWCEVAEFGGELIGSVQRELQTRGRAVVLRGRARLAAGRGQVARDGDGLTRLARGDRSPNMRDWAPSAGTTTRSSPFAFLRG